jgi:RNA recognition motif-containing protein
MPPARPEQQAFAPYGGFPMYQQQPAFPAFVPQMPAPPFMAPGMQPQGHYGPVHRATNPGALDGGNTNVSLYINHIGPHVTEEVLRQAFAVHGNVASVKIMREHGYGFVQFPDPAAAAQAMAALNNNMELSSGTPLQVSLKTASKKKPGFNATPAYPAPPKRYTPY